jgi:hypothetical protein
MRAYLEHWEEELHELYGVAVLAGGPDWVVPEDDLPLRRRLLQRSFHFLQVK